MDIDIDFANRDEVLAVLEHRVACLENGKKHNTGIYVTEIPHNPITNISTIDYKEAELRGYFKIDFLNVSIYKDVRDQTHMDKLVQTEPVWELLEYNEITDNLFHVSGHGEIMRKLKPKSLEDLAIALAIIRPAKRYLLDKDWETIKREIWKKPEDGQYYFKKAHAFSYSMAVMVHLNLLCENINPSDV